MSTFDLLQRSLKQAALAPAHKPPEDLKRKLPLDTQRRGQSQRPVASAIGLLQDRLVPGAPGDKLERQADRAADAVARGATDGRRLLAHELAHVLQQSATGLLGAVARTAQGNGPLPGNAPANATPLSRERWVQNPTLNAIRAAKPGDNRVLVSRGQQGEAVQLMQQALQAWGRDHGEPNLLPQFGADAAFGGETDRAIRRFQIAEGLVPDGVLGPITLSRLDAFVVGGAIRSALPSAAE